MTTQISKWGNSYAVRIPKEFIDNSKLRRGGLVDMTLEKGRLIIKPAKRKEKYTLRSLLKGMKKENLHDYVDWGKPVGKEIW